MPTIRVELFEGRTADQKRALAKALTDACVQAIDVPPASVDILFYELPKQHWATGGVLWSEAPASAPASTSTSAPASTGETPAMPLAD